MIEVSKVDIDVNLKLLELLINFRKSFHIKGNMSFWYAILLLLY